MILPKPDSTPLPSSQSAERVAWVLLQGAWSHVLASAWELRGERACLPRLSVFIDYCLCRVKCCCRGWASVIGWQSWLQLTWSLLQHRPLVLLCWCHLLTLHTLQMRLDVQACTAASPQRTPCSPTPAQTLELHPQIDRVGVSSADSAYSAKGAG